jgi:hypothetical protein
VRCAVINALLLFHILAIACWAFPIDTPLIVNLRNAVKPYMLWSGLFQRWNMFAPEPAKVDFYIEAEITLHDGEKRTWIFPRMEKLSYAQRYAKERYRKYMEYLRQDSYSALWPDAARHIARFYINPSNPPVFVILARYWSEIGPPGYGGALQRSPWSRVPFYIYVVKPDDLK